MRYKALDHLAIAVKSREESIPVYRDQLGFKFDRLGQSPGMGIYQAFFAYEDGRFLALIEPMEPNNAVDRSIQGRGEGFYVLSIEIDSLEATKKELSAKGVRLVNTEAPRGPVFIHPRCPHGLFIQLTQRGWPDAPAPAHNHHPDSPYRWLDHVVVAVKDLKQATATYRDTLGFTYERTAVLQPQGITSAFFHTDDGRTIEVSEPLGPDTPVGRALERRGEGVYLIALAVKDMAERVKALKAKGVQIIGGDKPGDQVFIHPRSTKGILIQLVERK
ncbi:MAG: VOC family protein [Chloroflexi bacterium]|nr:VOC family protein [Chloroflexota bacterium]